MKIDWFYLNSLAEANVLNFHSMFAASQIDEKCNYGSWDIFNKIEEYIFDGTAYTINKYKKDRETFLIEQKNINEFEKSLNIIIPLTDMEFSF